MSVESLLLSGHLLDLIIVLIALEIIVLAAAAQRWPGRVRLARLLPNLLSGAILMLCIRLAVTDANPRGILALLAAAFVAHAADLLLRLRNN